MNYQTPRVPDLWWTSEHGVLEDFRGSYLGVEGQSILDELPADAVKLGDVDGLLDETHRWMDANGRANGRVAELARELDGVRAVLASYDRDESSPWDVVDAIRAIVEGDR